MKRAAESYWRIIAIWEILDTGKLTKAEIAQMMGISKSNVQTLLARLALAGLAEVVGRQQVGNHYVYLWSRKKGRASVLRENPAANPNSAVSHSSPANTTAAPETQVAQPHTQP